MEETYTALARDKETLALLEQVHVRQELNNQTQTAYIASAFETVERLEQLNVRPSDKTLEFQFIMGLNRSRFQS